MEAGAAASNAERCEQEQRQSPNKPRRTVCQRACTPTRAPGQAESLLFLALYRYPYCEDRVSDCSDWGVLMKSDEFLDQERLKDFTGRIR